MTKSSPLWTLRWWLSFLAMLPFGVLAIVSSLTERFFSATEDWAMDVANRLDDWERRGRKTR